MPVPNRRQSMTPRLAAIPVQSPDSRGVGQRGLARQPLDELKMFAHFGDFGSGIRPPRRWPADHRQADSSRTRRLERSFGRATAIDRSMKAKAEAEQENVKAEPRQHTRR